MQRRHWASTHAKRLNKDRTRHIRQCEAKGEADRDAEDGRKQRLDAPLLARPLIQLINGVAHRLSKGSSGWCGIGQHRIVQSFLDRRCGGLSSVMDDFLNEEIANQTHRGERDAARLPMGLQKATQCYAALP